ncbi:MAG: Chaperonin Cpn60/TCP-1 [Methanomicrobiales archaeon 53_19]|uniref:thermosome subunit alpha n=1 Tax=Methanocalculus sp. TaxID=2004547 RepID=UPI000749EAA7|nr:thermosome subunit alpha [Methanocalculus sp.]KUK69567.1 MAG: Chaperonin Cpn60/TCP-1 [Methanocalculus sp. 52_23]KUL03864.1 MAG: Chaperonin Cpn60/TCP-1 [Methanomicrobiales archaeon 53_19]HIJ06590.1 thermosome subunit [Methanocalculus sp.]
MANQNQLTGQPIIILRDNVEQTRGHEAQRSNILAAKAISEAVRTTLGPRGMDKMLVHGDDITITNDGATILSELSVQHPGAKMVVEVATAQDDECGDGTTTAAIMVGSFMEQAERMLKMGIHPTNISKGYSLGMKKSLEILSELAVDVTPDDKESLKKIAKTAMIGKAIEAVMEKAADIVVDAVATIADSSSGRISIDEDDILVKTQTGDAMDDIELVRGVIIGKARVDEQMPKIVTGAKVAMISTPLEITKTQTKSKIKISSSEQVAAFGDAERASLKKIADQIIASGANVLLCQKGIADSVQFYLAKAGIYTLEDVPEKEMKYAAKALCGEIVNKAEDLTAETLGTAEQVEQMYGEDLTKISGCENAKAVTILIRGSTQYLIDELDRAINDAKRVIQDAMEDGKYTIGGAAVETEMIVRIREYATTIGGREQIAVEAFANAFEIIPITLAENSGFNPIDKLVELKKAHSNGQKNAGLNVFTGKIVDMSEEGVFEPMRVKRQAIQSAAEIASLLIRVDDMMVTQSHAPGQ